MANNNQVSTQNTELNELHQIGGFGVNELMTMKETVGKDLSIPQFNLFMYQCNRMGLDPSLRHAFPIVYGGKMDIRVSYEGLKSLAQKSEGYQGVFTQVVCENEVDDFDVVLNDDGEMVGVKHKPRFPRGKVMGAYAVAKRENRSNYVVFMDVSEVQKWMKINGKFWKQDNGDVDPDMFKKHVGTRAIKGQFDIADVIVEGMEAVNTENDIPEYKPRERKDITPNQDALDQPSSKAEPTEEEKQIQKIRTEITKKLKILGIVGKAKVAEYIAKNAPDMGENPTLAEYTGLLNIIEMNIEMMEMNTDSDELE
ncbi:RecT family recombinase [Metabacillus litoralis]|uniref:RecT family recombinase n=1 Tax=Metabacillus litoralis TaxID=152268 RepID=UPI00203F2EAC|nr:RecT family recombinase [Metabacillus litoralis]MCM3411488.1 recombinase RecT [Metabacillus litoralis]